MLEQAPRIERIAKREKAREVLHALNDHIEIVNKELSELFQQFRAALDILNYAEETGTAPERVEELRAQARELKERVLDLSDGLKPIEDAAEKLADTFDADVV